MIKTVIFSCTIILLITITILRFSKFAIRWYKRNETFNYLWRLPNNFMKWKLLLYFKVVEVAIFFVWFPYFSWCSCTQNNEDFIHDSWKQLWVKQWNGRGFVQNSNVDIVLDCKISGVNLIIDSCWVQPKIKQLSWHKINCMSSYNKRRCKSFLITRSILISWSAMKCNDVLSHRIVQVTTSMRKSKWKINMVLIMW